MKKNLHYAVFSGLCASTASIFGKLTGLPVFEGNSILRIFFFLCMIVANGGVWTLFVKALHSSESSLVATVISSASNYIFSALAGFVIFGEVTSLLWWSGMFFIIVGLLMVLSDQKSINQTTRDFKE